MIKILGTFGALLFISCVQSGAIDQHNIETISTNCPEGHVQINGQCSDMSQYYDLSKYTVTISPDLLQENIKKIDEDPKNVIAVPCQNNDYKSVSSNLSYKDKKENKNTPKNIVTVPPNCPPGQELVNGECREIWKDHDAKNIITVPPNCPPGQEYINGECREIWKKDDDPKNVITVPPSCPPGYEYINGQCREIWKNEAAPMNMITVPPSCPPGQEYINGQCREVWNNEAYPMNMITVPPSCPPGQEYINGQCREIWKKETDSKNMITVPPSCPPGYEYINGQCREIWKNGVHPMNMITVPPRCPPGYEYINGQCREIWKNGVHPMNMITVPPSCPPGYEYINGQCREIWKNGVHPMNMITVPPSCPPGYEYINGQCREIWKNGVHPMNMITVPPSCPPGYEYINGQCREIWKNKANPMNVITVPPSCPPGYEYINGQCREIWNNDNDPKNGFTVPPSNCSPELVSINGPCGDNVITVSPNRPPGQENPDVITISPTCLAGQEYVNGQCRDVCNGNEVYKSITANSLCALWKNLNILKNMITLSKPVCMNAQCSDSRNGVMNPDNVIARTTNCLLGQILVNEQCRDIQLWMLFKLQFGVKTHETDIQNTHTQKCRPNQQWWNGLCFDMYQNEDKSPAGYNIQTMCLFGEEYVKGECREINSLRNEQHVLCYHAAYFVRCVSVERQDRAVKLQDTEAYHLSPPELQCTRDTMGVNSIVHLTVTRLYMSSKLWTSIATQFHSFFTRKKRQSESDEEHPEIAQFDLDRKVIHVPYQCPSGYRADALGYCRPTFR